jgi:hypothetical protein
MVPPATMMDLHSSTMSLSFEAGSRRQYLTVQAAAVSPGVRRIRASVVNSRSEEQNSTNGSKEDVTRALGSGAALGA